MTLKEIVKLCNQMAELGVEEGCFVEDGQPDATAKKVVQCANCVIEQLYCDFATALTTCQVTSQNGVIDVSAMRFNRVVSLTDSLGNNVPYRYTEGGIAVPDGTYTLTYALLPPKTQWEEEVKLPSPRITERIVAYGVVAEYFFQTGDYAAANAWESRFKNALRLASVKTSSMNMPVGRWT